MKRRAQRRIDCGSGAGGAMLAAQNASAARMPVASLLSFAIAVTAGAPAAAGVQSATAADAKPAVAAPVDPLFDCYRLNYAWGFTLAGSVVGRDGTILHYRMRDKDRSPKPDREGGAALFSTAALRAKFETAEASGHVEASVLATQVALVEKAAQGTISQADTGTRDAGSSTCHAYVRDEAHDRYRDVELGSDGAVSDLRATNSAAEAQQLIEWLRSVGVAK